MKEKHVQSALLKAVFAGVDAALRRAQKRARETAAQTGTPLVIFRNGKIERIAVRRDKKSKTG
ncbi:MAG: hypothetical protein L0Y72_20700 [Gemmataceae bacterium]|nr:hypothetical protein [Gemmataceae bacterium]MCI0741460.1 hypothetical protein [Gemmataceae bacterium]